MIIGCSECLCIAIESHRSALLKWLLQRSDVQYRDTYWAPTPTHTSWKVIEGEEEHNFPVLHDMGPDVDLSIVGRDDCGHMRVDVELCAPFKCIWKARAYILVSLPMIARWHTSERFDAERILRQSGKFDYSDPQFSDVQYRFGMRNDLPGPLNVLEKDWFNSTTMCEYECRNESFRSVSIDCSTNCISVNEPSTLPCHMPTVRVSIMSKEINFTKFYGQLIREFFTNKYELCGAGILERIQKILECGGDLNDCLLSRQVYSFSFYPYTRFDWEDPVRWNAYRNECFFDLISTWTNIFDNPIELNGKLNYVGIRDVNRFTIFLLRNGLSFFYKRSSWQWQWEWVSADNTMLTSLILQYSRMPEALLPIARGIAHQLLALGYGRRELHPAPLLLHDEHLVAMTRQLQYHATHSISSKLIGLDELQSLVQHFREGPLALQRLARIAIRRAVGGAAFAKQVLRLAGHIPPALVQYVADPTELMLSDDEVDRHVKNDV